jgi:hypothetical protein
MFKIILTLPNQNKYQTPNSDKMTEPAEFLSLFWIGGFEKLDQPSAFKRRK